MPAHPNDFVNLPEMVGKSFYDTTAQIDGTSYKNCSFNRCRLIYRGGPTLFLSCSIASNCTVDLQDAAAFILQTLRDLGWKVVPPRHGISQKPRQR
jgi:hypothetical protein